MNRRDLVFVASRVVALYLLIPTLLYLLSSPFEFYSMHSIGRGTFPGSDQMVRSYGHVLWGGLLTDAVKLIIGWRFWKCSPTIERLFSE